MHGFVLLLHVLAATVWTGGHLILALTVLPGVLNWESPSELLKFESRYETVGMPALLIQVATGLWLAHDLVPDASRWLSFQGSVERLVGIKLCLLGLTVVLAADARLRIIPKLSPANLVPLARRIAAVTTLSVLFVAVGVSFRTGWYY